MIPGPGRTPGEGSDTHSSILAGEIPWTEEPVRLQSMGSQRVRRDLTKQQQHQPRTEARARLLSWLVLLIAMNIGPVS